MLLAQSAAAGSRSLRSQEHQRLWYPREIYLFPPNLSPCQEVSRSPPGQWVQQYQQPQVYQAEQKLFQELSSETHDRARPKGDT